MADEILILTFTDLQVLMGGVKNGSIVTQMTDKALGPLVRSSNEAGSLRQKHLKPTTYETMSETRDKVTTEKFRVKRRLGLLSSVSLIVGNIIGSGIFISPRNVLAKTRSVGLCLVTWALCGVISMCAALVYAELGTLIPKSGAEHAYFLKTYGSFVSFLYVWCQAFVTMPGSMTVKALTLSEYLSEVIFDECGQSMYMKKIIATTAIYIKDLPLLLTVSVAITNCISVRLTARVQIFFTFVKLMGLVVIIVGGIWWMSTGQFGSLVTGFDGTTNNVQDFALAVYSGLWAYDGWGGLNSVTEEIKNPKRNLPLGIVISVLLVTAVYLLVNVSYLSVLTKSEFLSSLAVGVTWAEQVIGPAVILIPIVVICSVYGSSNGSNFTSSRLLFQAAREGHMPELCSYIHVHSLIPLPSVLLLTTLSLIYMIPAEISGLMNLLNFIGWLFYGMAMIAVIILRWKMKDTKRVIKVPLVIPVLVLLICVYLVVTPFIQDPKVEFLYALAILGLGAVVYVPMVHFKVRMPGMVSLAHMGQCLLDVVPTHLVKDDEL
ncbi:b(0,+)-type amino acid transporter 1-like [Ylistrum balloti]|uniref:b(0,+)-type amino acid transporter 1-like n=1 Tax=Ylistrum balloti TaxID=509963 RepID=UPI002905CF2C|nr:b(0,+)-type amino acid transporter 1-like [Ylistrum balloti]